MDGDGTNGVIDLEAPFDPEMQLVANRYYDCANQHGLDRMVKIVSSGSGYDTTQPARERPVRIAAGNQISRQHPAGERHQEVEGNCRQRGGRQVDRRCRPGVTGYLSGSTGHINDACRADDRDVARGIKSPETGVDGKQTDTDEPGIVRRNIARGSVSPELANTRSQHDQGCQGSSTGNGVHDTRRIGIVIAEQSDHPSIGMPAPGGIENPQYGSQKYADEPEGAHPHPLDNCA